MGYLMKQCCLLVTLKYKYNSLQKYAHGRIWAVSRSNGQWTQWHVQLYSCLLPSHITFKTIKPHKTFPSALLLLTCSQSKISGPCPQTHVLLLHLGQFLLHTPQQINSAEERWQRGLGAWVKVCLNIATCSIFTQVLTGWQPLSQPRLFLDNSHAQSLNNLCVIWDSSFHDKRGDCLAVCCI